MKIYKNIIMILGAYWNIQMYSGCIKIICNSYFKNIINVSKDYYTYWNYYNYYLIIIIILLLSINY
jgi:hypothetical protein